MLDAAFSADSQGDSIGGRSDERLGVASSSAVPPLVSLVPNSGIQFIDFHLSEQDAAHTRRRFFEDRGEASDGETPSLHVGSIADGVFYHPTTGEPCDPAQTYAIDGCSALDPYLDTWLPLPYMRITGRDGTMELGLDEGPSNWVRVHVSRAGSGFHAVLAVDTAIEGGAEQPQRAYASPTLDDLRSGASFRFSDDVDDVAWFATEAWVDDWLSEAFRAGRRRGRSVDAGEPADPGALEHLAHYLGLLAVLKEVCALPALRFMEPNAVGAYAETIPVDIALDIGGARTAALVQERDARAAGTEGAATAALPIRDLQHPARRYHGLFSSRIEFARAQLGNDALSRWSGRTRAFHWPSLTRVGEEAERLAREPASADSVTGVSSPMHYVWDDKPSRHVWRFAGAVTDGARRNPIVSGALLAHVAENGDVLEARSGRGATTKPRFSRSSLLTFFAAEILLHAVSAINSHAHRAGSARPAVTRRLDRVLVTSPAGMPEPERLLLRQRIESAVRLVWKVMGWTEAMADLAPPQPTVVLVADSATSTQIAWLRNEVAHKFRGRAEPYLSLMGRPRAGFAGTKALRVATLDIGATGTGLTIATYEPGAAGSLVCSRQLVDGFDIGTEDAVEAIAERVVLPAIEQRLADCKIGDAGRFVRTLTAGEHRDKPAWVGDIGRRFVADIVAPAARALLRMTGRRGDVGAETAAETTVRALLDSLGLDATQTAERLDLLAADEGADGYSPLDTSIPFLPREVVETASDSLRPMLDSAVRAISSLDCDVVLLTGDGARHAAVMETLLAGMPLRPDRIVDMHDYRVGAWAPFRDATGRMADAKLLGVLGALLQGGDAFGGAAPELVLRALDPGGQHAYIGLLDADGHIEGDDVLYFTGDESTPRTRTIYIDPPRLVGLRRTALRDWPAQALYVLELGELHSGRRPRFPVKATVELTPPEHGKPVALKLVSAHDADGNRLDATELALRLKTRRFPDAHWLDCGRLQPLETGI